MKKTIFFIAGALPCLFFWVHSLIKSRGGIPYSRKIKSEYSFQFHLHTMECVAKLAASEIILEKLLRKKILRLTMMLMLFSTALFAQGKKLEPTLMINDKVPNLALSQILNYKQKSANISSFRDKALILEFWATYCSPCISEFPKLDAMQKQFGKNIQIILMNTYPSDTKEVLEKFVVGQKAIIQDFSLPIVMYDPIIKEVFPINTMPHYIWIGSDGRIKAITRPDQLTKENVSRLIAGLTLNLKTKKD